MCSVLFVNYWCQMNPGSASVGGTPVTGPSSTGRWGGWALPVTQIWIRCLRWYKTNPGLVVFGCLWGKKKSAHSVDSSGRLISHFGHITDLIRDKWSGARSSQCLCRLVWQTWLLHRFICPWWYSHHAGRGQGWTHRQAEPFFSDQSLKLQFSLKASKIFSTTFTSPCWITHAETLADKGPSSSPEVASSTIVTV